MRYSGKGVEVFSAVKCSRGLGFGRWRAEWSWGSGGKTERWKVMEKKDLKKILAGFSIAGLVAAGISTAVVVQPALAA